MRNTVTEEPEGGSAVSDRRRPDPAANRILEALELSEAQLMASTAKLAATDRALEAARQRELQLLEILEKGQQRLQKLVVGAAATAVLIVVLLSIILAYMIKTHTH